MRNTPSFIGEFPSKHKPKRYSSPPELPIEKEANLREKKKKILQRLKKNVDPGDAMEVAASRPVPIEEVPEKVIFSPRTSKKFQQATQQLAELTSSHEIKRSDKVTTPLIVLQKAEKDEVGSVEEEKRRQGYDNSVASRKLDLSGELRNEDERVLPYIPSFTEKPKRHLAESIPRKQKQDKLSKPTNKTSDLEVSSTTTSRNQKQPHINQQGSKEVPLIVTEKDTPDIEFSFSDDDDNDFDSYTGSSPFRRSASFHNLKDSHQEQSRQIRTSAGKRRQFLKVDDYSFTKASSLSSLYNHPSSSLAFGGSDGDLSTSSTSFAKQQQQKLEEDFQRVEENLNRAFSELRKYLRTS